MTAAERRRKLREERTSKFKERLANRRSSRPETTDARSLQAKRRRERNPKEEQPTKTIGRDATKRRKLDKAGALKVAQVLPTKEGSLADTFVKGAELWQKYGKKQEKTDAETPTEPKPGQVQDTQKPTQKQPVETPKTDTKTRYNQGANTKNKGSNKVDSPAKKLKLNPNSKDWRKSDVFTKLPGSNKTRGVMTRAQAKAFDLKNQKALQKLKPDQFRQWGGWKGWG